MSLRTVTSGWQYADWRDVLYPVGLLQRAWLAAYSQGFATVEVDAAFYRLPARDLRERLDASAPTAITPRVPRAEGLRP